MQKSHSTRPKPLFLIVSLVVLLPFMLAACGSIGGSGARPAATPTPTPKIVQGYGTAHGCPSDAVVMTAPPAANVIVKRADAHATIMAHVGDVIELQLPFGQKWTGPLASVGGCNCKNLLVMPVSWLLPSSVPFSERMREVARTGIARLCSHHGGRFPSSHTLLPLSL